MAKVLAEQGGGVVEPLALGVDRAVVDDAGYHVGGEAVRGLRQLDGGDVEPPEASAFVLLSAGGASGRWEMFAEGRICTGQGNDHTGCKRGGEVVYAAPAAFLFVVCGLIDELVVDVAEAAGKAVVFHRVMSSEMSASLSEAREPHEKRGGFGFCPAHARGEGGDAVEVPVAADEGDAVLARERGEPAVDAAVISAVGRRRVRARWRYPRRRPARRGRGAASPPPRFCGRRRGALDGRCCA